MEARVLGIETDPVRWPRTTSPPIEGSRRRVSFQFVDLMNSTDLQMRSITSRSGTRRGGPWTPWTTRPMWSGCLPDDARPGNQRGATRDRRHPRVDARALRARRSDRDELPQILRATRDIDLLILLPGVQFQAFADALNAAGFGCMTTKTSRRRRSRADGSIHEGHRTVSRLVEARQGELFVPMVPLQDSVLKRRFRVEDGDAGVWVQRWRPYPAQDDLPPDKDLVDVRRLIAANRDSFDRVYVESWIRRRSPKRPALELRDMLQAAGA